jgi:hypothetical protein
MIVPAARGLGTLPGEVLRQPAKRDAPRAGGASNRLSPLPSGIPSDLPSSLRIENPFW